MGVTNSFIGFGRNYKEGMRGRRKERWKERRLLKIFMRIIS